MEEKDAKLTKHGQVKRVIMTSLEEIQRVKEKVEKELLKIPNVTGVDIGYKYVGGKKTDVLAIRIYVEKKKKDVPEKEMIPKKINNIPTDVIERRFVLHSDQPNVDKNTHQES